MPPRRSITLLSVVVHAAVVSAVILGQFLSLGPIPTPRTVLAFSDAMPAQMRDIPLPPPQRGAPAPAEHTSLNAAPIEAPRDIVPETGRENQTSTRQSNDFPGVESGVPGGIGDLPGQGLTVEPPAPPPTPPQKPIRLSAMQPPQKTFNVAPRYPANAQTVRVQGLVVLDAVIDSTGRVTDVHVIRSIPLLDQAAIDAVRQWRFTPTILNGQAVPVLLTVSVKFTLEQP